MAAFRVARANPDCGCPITSSPSGFSSPLICTKRLLREPPSSVCGSGGNTKTGAFAANRLRLLLLRIPPLALHTSPPSTCSDGLKTIYLRTQIHHLRRPAYIQSLGRKRERLTLNCRHHQAFRFERPARTREAPRAAGLFFIASFRVVALNAVRAYHRQYLNFA